MYILGMSLQDNGIGLLRIFTIIKLGFECVM